MSRLIATSRRRTIFATLVLSVVVLAVIVLSIPANQAAPGGNCTYYNNANHSKVVGQFGYDCCNNRVAWGVTSSYYSCGGCFICFPPPR